MVGTGVIQKDEDWGRCDQLLQFVKGYLFRLFPFPSNNLLGEVKQGMSMVGEVFDEPPVKVDESNKRLNLLLVLRSMNWLVAIDRMSKAWGHS